MAENALKTASTVRITNPPNGYFKLDQQLYVKEIKIDGRIVVNRAEQDFILSTDQVEEVAKKWAVVRCPNPDCRTILFEVDKASFTEFSIRTKCRRCKEYIIV